MPPFLAPILNMMIRHMAIRMRRVLNLLKTILQLTLHMLIPVLLLINAISDHADAKEQATTTKHKSLYQSPRGQRSRVQPVECDETQGALVKQRILRDIKHDSEGELLKQYLNEIEKKHDIRQHWSDAFIMRAQRREAKRQFEKAAEDARQFFALRPSARWATAAGARILIEAGDCEDALPHLRAHIFSITNHTGPYALLSLGAACCSDYNLAANSLIKAFTIKFGRMEIKINKLFCTEQTLSVLRQRCCSGIRRKPSDPHWHIVLAIVEILSKNFLSARSEIDQCLRTNQDMPELWILRANCDMARGELKSVLNDINQSARLSPKSLDIYATLECYYNLSGKFDRFFDDMDKRIAKDPANVTLWIAKAHAYEKLSDTTKAFECYAQAASIDPKCTEAINGRALIDEQLFDYTGAISEFSASIKINPDDPRVYKDRATCYFALHKDKETIDDLSRVIDLTGDPYAYAMRARCYERLGKSELASQDNLMARKNEEQRW